jgi:hypothetical protein
MKDMVVPGVIAGFLALDAVLFGEAAYVVREVRRKHTPPNAAERVSAD